LTTKLLGRDDIATPGSGAANQIFMTKSTCDVSGVVPEVHIHVLANKSGNMYVGIWADSSGEPGALLGTTAPTAISSGVERSVTIPLMSNVSVDAGTSYWIGSNQDANNLNALKSETSVNRYKSLTYGALPNPAGTGYTTYTTDDFVAAGWGTPTVPFKSYYPNILSQ
jgi:hypothetical protein